jgi:AmpD protein
MGIMQIDLQTNLLKDAEYCVTNCFDERPAGADISLLVIHNISLPEGEFGGPYIKQLFLGELDKNLFEPFGIAEGLKASTHLFIDRQGAVMQFVPFDKRAWHAGRSSFQGQDECNDYSIGIEVEGTDTTPYTDAQYKTLGEVSRAIMMAYPLITRERITGHDTIAPDRKTDPGPTFDWTRYFGLL